jgi:hypothetical protein
MFNESGYRVLQTVPTPIPLQIVIPATNHRVFGPLHELHYLLVCAWKTLFAYQFVLRAVANVSIKNF